jgi:hypothetical protein
MTGAYKKLTGQTKADQMAAGASTGTGTGTGTGTTTTAQPGMGGTAAAAITQADTTMVGGELRGTAGNAARALAFQDDASRRRATGAGAKILLGS